MHFSSCWKYLHRTLQDCWQLHLINSGHAKETSASSLRNGKYLLSTFPHPYSDRSSSMLSFSKHLYHIVFCKHSSKCVLICCDPRGTVHQTKSRSNKAISSSYISLFYCADASFTNFFVISGKVSICHRRWFCFYRYIVSQPLKTWKKGRALADITPQFDAPLPEPYP